MLPEWWPWRSAAWRIGAIAGLLTVALGFLESYLFPSSAGLLGYSMVGLAVATGTFVVGRFFIQKPLDELRRALDQAADSDFLLRAATHHPNELSGLVSAANRLFARITDLQVQSIESRRELSLKAELANKASIIVEKNAALATRLREQSLLFDLLRTASTTLDLEDILRTICENASAALGYEEVAILLVDPQSQKLVVRAAHGFPPDAKIVGTTLTPGEGISGVVAESRQALVIPDTAKDTRYLHYKGKHLQDGSFLCCPIQTRDRLLGLFNVLRPGANGFADADIRLATSIASCAALAIANAQLHADVSALSMTDELTGLPNRRAFQQRIDEEIERADRGEDAFGVLMIDIDHFKRLNDTHGHAAGDDALRLVARRLRSSLRRLDHLARLGGEEFVAILPRQARISSTQIAEKLRAAVAATQLGVGSVTISIGVATFPDDGRTAETLLETADRALFAAKRAGRNRVSSSPERPHA